MAGGSVQLEFIYTPLVEASIKGLLDDESMRRIESDLLQNPQRGDVIAGTGGVRKVRATLAGRGKRSGARIIYFFVAVRSRIYFLLAYAKNQKVDLTAIEKHTLQALAHKLEREA